MDIQFILRLSYSVSGPRRLGQYLQHRAKTRGQFLEFGHLFFAEFERVHALVDRVGAQLDRHVSYLFHTPEE